MNPDFPMSMGVFKSIGEDLESVVSIEYVVPVFYSKGEIINT